MLSHPNRYKPKPQHIVFFSIALAFTMRTIWNSSSERKDPAAHFGARRLRKAAPPSGTKRESRSLGQRKRKAGHKQGDTPAYPTVTSNNNQVDAEEPTSTVASMSLSRPHQAISLSPIVSFWGSVDF
ncbi:hypothetical protein GGI35DRAFT_347226 [Trichoderma velutinum]